MSAASGGPQRRARRQWYASRFSFLRGVRTHARSICLVGFLGYLAGCGSAPAPETFSSQPVSDLSGHWEVDYAQSDSVQTQINARFREVQREMRRRQDASSKAPDIKLVQSVISIRLLRWPRWPN